MPAAPDPRTAARIFLQALGTAVDCVTAQRLFAQPDGYEPDVLYAVALGRTAEPVPLPAKAGGASGLYFDLRHQYVIVADGLGGGRLGWRVSTRSYEYRLLDGRLTELLVYHWQPNSVAGGPQFPHLHVSAELTARTSFEVRQPFPLHSRHLPTGRVSLEAIIRLLIAEFGIAYRHRNWLSRLHRTETVFRQEMTQRP